VEDDVLEQAYTCSVRQTGEPFGSATTSLDWTNGLLCPSGDLRRVPRMPNTHPQARVRSCMGFMEREIAEEIPGVIGEYAVIYLAALENEGRALATRYEQHRELAMLVIEYPASGPGELTTMDIERHLAIRCHGLAPATRKKTLAILSGFFGYLHDRGVVPSNPTHPIRRPHIPEPEPTYWNGEEIRAILHAEMLPRDHLLLETLARTGQRVGTVRALRWSDVLLDGKAPEIHFRRGKGGRVATIPIDRELLHDLIVYQRLAHPDPDAVVFLSRKGNPLSPQQVNRIIEQACRKAGVRVASAHEFRRSCITNLLHAGVPFDVVSRDIAGHRSPVTTMRHYRGSESQRVREALRGLPY
jgi:integrase